MTNRTAETDKKPIRIREMEIDDLAEVYHLGEQVFLASRVPNMYRTWDQHELIGIFNTDPEYSLVADRDDEIVGFALGTTITKSHSAWKYGHLLWLGVKPGFQRLGLADRLFRRFKDLMLKDGVRMLIVDTEAENLPALHFFRKVGFRQPQQHIYLFMNLAAEQQRLRKRENGAPAGVKPHKPEESDDRSSPVEKTS